MLMILLSLLLPVATAETPSAPAAPTASAPVATALSVTLAGGELSAAPGSETSTFVTLKNEGDVPFEITGVSINQDGRSIFTLEGPPVPYTLLARTTRSIRLRFRPSEPGMFAAMLTVRTSVGERTIPVVATSFSQGPRNAPDLASDDDPGFDPLDDGTVGTLVGNKGSEMGDPDRELGPTSTPAAPSSGSLASRNDGGVMVVGTDPVIVGDGLTQAQIDDVIKRNASMLRYCYQRELSKDPALAGSVKVQFVVMKDGTVGTATAKEATLPADGVPSCATGRFMRFQFPAPKGGKTVTATYTFVYAPS